MSAKNRHRVKREIEERSKRDPDFAAILAEHDHPFVDVLTGCTTRAVFIILSFGLVGGEHIVEGFHQLHHLTDHVASTPIDSAPNDTAGNIVSHQATGANCHAEQTTEYPQAGHSGSSQNGTPNNNIWDKQFHTKHPSGAHFDDVVKSATGGVSDKAAHALGAHTQHAIDNNIYSAELHKILSHEWHSPSGHTGKVVAQAVLVGAYGELLQPLTQAVDIGVDEGMKWHTKRKVR